jgi:hypothetical protein
MKKGYIYILICIILLTGCAIKPVFLVPNYTPPTTIAVLPFMNDTVDLDGPILLRKLATEKLESKHYSVKPVDQVDQLLNEEGITNAGQLPAMTPQELGKTLGVDAVLYGRVIEFKYTTLGIYFKRAVKVQFKLVSTQTGDTLWEDIRTSYHDEIVTSDYATALGNQLKEKAVDKLFKSPLMKESQDVILYSFITLPSVR